QELTCFPAIKTIASDCNMSKRTVQRALNDLLEVGMIKKESRYRENGGQSSNLYTICINEHDEEQPFNNVPENNVESTEDVGQLDIENISFSDYLDSVEQSNESNTSVDNEILEGERTFEDKALCVNDNSFQFRPHFEQNMFSEKFICHGEGDNLVPP
ncbi:MAG: hypothetical protein PWP27_2779, partial [Clostridiales bacterium]|nr:hypothetical protein [Clostridiales bacterium]